MRSLRISLSLLTLAATLVPIAAQARVIRTSSSSAAPAVTRTTALTWGEYRGKSLYLPGTWAVESADTSVAFTKGGQTVRAITIGKDDCAYTAIRIRAQKAWNTKRLEQSQSQIRTVVLGRSDYKGYTWFEPPQESVINQHWCLAQDAKSAVELIVSSSDESLLAFARQNLIRQLAVRRAAR
jgi:hypothetical protein